MVIREALLPTLLQKHKDKPSQPTLTVPKKDVTPIIILRVFYKH